VGVRCGHEDVFGQAGFEFAQSNIQFWDADSSWFAAPYLQESLLENTLIVHLVRHPKDTIDSFLSMRFWTLLTYAGFAAWTTQWLPDLNNYKTPEEKSAYFYVKWNQMIEPHAGLRHRVEDPVEQLLERLGIDYHGKVLFNNTTYNTRRTWPSDIDLSLLGEPLTEMKVRYGYN